MEKDSIVFYKDWWEALKQLPEDKRLEAMSAVMDYAFEGTEPADTMLRFATAYIRDKIDRNRKKYEETCSKRKEAIEKRWKKQNTPEKDPQNTNVYNCIEKNTNEYNSIQPNTTQYLHEHEHEHEHGKINTSNYLQTDNKTRAGVNGGQSVRKLIDEQVAECKSSPIWKEGIRMKFHIADDAEVDRLLDEFAVDMLCQETEVRNAKRFFISWLTDKQQKKLKGGQSPNGLGKGEWRDNQGRRRFAKSDVIVPEDAPPRPSEAHYWSPAANQWEKAL